MLIQFLLAPQDKRMARTIRLSSGASSIIEGKKDQK